MATGDQRQHMKGVMNWFTTNRNLIGYKEQRPMQTISLFEQSIYDNFKRGWKMMLDCSEMATLICRLAGLHDPNGSGYSGYGDTLTLYRHLPHYTDPERAGIGALVVFGAPFNPLSNQHVALVYNTSIAEGDPLLFSHGSSAGPILLKLSEYEAAEPSQGKGVFLDISQL